MSSSASNWPQGYYEVPDTALPRSAGSIGWTYGTFFHDLRQQSIYSKAYLNSVGITGAGYIYKVGLMPRSKPSLDFNDFRIGMRQTTLASFATQDFLPVTSVVTRTVTTAAQLTANEFEPHDLQHPFYWDGVSNIVVEVAYDNAASTPSGGTSLVCQGSTTQTISFTSNSASGAYPFSETAASGSVCVPVIRFEYFPIDAPVLSIVALKPDIGTGAKTAFAITPLTAPLSTVTLSFREPLNPTTFMANITFPLSEIIYFPAGVTNTQIVNVTANQIVAFNYLYPEALVSADATFNGKLVDPLFINVVKLVDVSPLTMTLGRGRSSSFTVTPLVAPTATVVYQLMRGNNVLFDPYDLPQTVTIPAGSTAPVTVNILANQYVRDAPFAFAPAVSDDPLFDESYPGPIQISVIMEVGPDECSFEVDECQWTNPAVGDDFDWQRVQGSARALSTTGPGVDHTLGTSAGYFMLLDATGQLRTQTASFFVKEFVGTDTCEMRFWFHMFGDSDADMSVLKVQSKEAGTVTWTDVDLMVNGVAVAQLEDNQGDQWKLATADLSAFHEKTVQVRFLGVRGDTDLGDIGIDDVMFKDCKVNYATHSPSASPSSSASASVSASLSTSPSALSASYSASASSSLSASPSAPSSSASASLSMSPSASASSSNSPFLPDSRNTGRTPPAGSGVVGGNFNIAEPFQPTTEFTLTIARQAKAQLADALGVNATRITIVTSTPVTVTPTGYNDGTAIFFEIAPASDSHDASSLTPEEALSELQLQANDPTSAIRAAPLLGSIDTQSFAQLCTDGVRRPSCLSPESKKSEAKGWPFAIFVVAGFLLLAAALVAVWFTRRQSLLVGKVMSDELTDLEADRLMSATKQTKHLSEPWEAVGCKPVAVEDSGWSLPFSVDSNEPDLVNYDVDLLPDAANSDTDSTPVGVLPRPQIAGLLATANSVNVLRKEPLNDLSDDDSDAATLY
jgi:hypothetical protein